jgi:hypothetical protein
MHVFFDVDDTILVRVVQALAGTNESLSGIDLPMKGPEP